MSRNFIVLRISCVNILWSILLCLLLIILSPFFSITIWSLLDILNKLIKIHLLQLFRIFSKFLNFLTWFLLLYCWPLLVFFTEISFRNALGRMISANGTATLSLRSYLTIHCTFRVRTSTSMINAASFRSCTVCSFYPSFAVRIIASSWIREELLVNIVLWMSLRLWCCRGLLCYLIDFLLLLLLRHLLRRLLLLRRRFLLFLGFKLKYLFCGNYLRGIHVKIITAHIRAQKSIIWFILDQQTVFDLFYLIKIGFKVFATFPFLECFISLIN
jgi:hypothetical protein